MDTIIKTVGKYAIPCFFGYLGYLFYDKDTRLSGVLILIGIVLGVAVIWSEINFKQKRHDAPWLFDKYRGE